MELVYIFKHSYWPGHQAKVRRERALRAQHNMWRGMATCTLQKPCVTAGAASCVISSGLALGVTNNHQSLSSLCMCLVLSAPEDRVCKEGEKGNRISWLHLPLEDTIVHQQYIKQLLFLTINLLINLTPLRLFTPICFQVGLVAGFVHYKCCTLHYEYAGAK